MLKPSSLVKFAGGLVNIPPSGGGGVTNTGNAAVGDVASGKTFSSAALTNATGTSTKNATVPGDAPIQPAQAFVDAFLSFLETGIFELTNAQKLSLPVNTPVGTQVTVTDWEAAGLTGPHQRLIAPSIAQGGVFVSGGTEDGVWSKDPSPINGKASFTFLGQTVGGNYQFHWSTNLNSEFGAGPSSAGFGIYDVTNGGLIYYSLSAVATPDLASDWLNASDDSSASITVISVTRGELDAGITIAGAGTPEVNGIFFGPMRCSGPSMDPGDAAIFNGGNMNVVTRALHNSGEGWQIGNPALGGYASAQNIALPWQITDLTPDDGEAPAPTISRNDVATEQNWETVSP